MVPWFQEETGFELEIIRREAPQSKGSSFKNWGWVDHAHSKKAISSQEKQRSKCKWDAYKDQSSKFFYISVKVRALRNEIWGIKGRNGDWIQSPPDIRVAFKDHFMGIRNGSSSTSPLMDSQWLQGLSTLSDLHSPFLLNPFSKSSGQFLTSQISWPRWGTTNVPLEILGAGGTKDMWCGSFLPCLKVSY